MGSVIKAKELWAPPVRLGDRRRRELLGMLTVAADDADRIARSRERIVELALGMARRIVGRQVELEPGLLDEIYRRSLMELGDLPPTAIHVFPADREPAGIEPLAAKLGCAVISDPAVGPGGCRVEADGAAVDASIEVVIGALREALEVPSRG